MEVSLTNEVILIVPTPIARSIFPTIPLIGQLFGGISHRLEKYESSPHMWRVAPESSTIPFRSPSGRQHTEKREKLGFEPPLSSLLGRMGGVG
jgi:hypothetical protein